MRIRAFHESRAATTTPPSLRMQHSKQGRPKRTRNNERSREDLHSKLLESVLQERMTMLVVACKMSLWCCFVMEIAEVMNSVALP